MSLENKYDVDKHKKMFIAGLDSMIKLYAETKGRVLNTHDKKGYELELEIFTNRLKELEDVTDSSTDEARVEAPPLEIHGN
jgi:hypothetical protein